jgi:hypothetical protein
MGDRLRHTARHEQRRQCFNPDPAIVSEACLDQYALSLSHEPDQAQPG